MDPTDFQYLVRISEQEAEANPDAYRRKVLWFAMLGIAYVVFTLVLGAGLLWLSVKLFGSGRKFFVAGMCGLSGLSLLWLGVRALYAPTPLPQGFEVTRDMAPELFDKLAKLQKKLKAPPIHRVIVTDDFNAFISQQLRWGFFGKSTNTLGVGLPLVLTLNSNRFLSVLAHEYAHLRGQDSRSSARLYRIHHAWMRLADYSEARTGGDSSDVYSWLTTAFLRWYKPRFLAKSFAVARQEEYRADAWSARLYGADITGAALLEIALLAHHVPSEHWRQYWQLAHQHATPPTYPYAWLAARQLKPPQPHSMQEALHRLKHERASFDDTHPRTLERIEALQQPLALPEPSMQHAGKLLGGALRKAISHYDAEWWQRQRAIWSVVHRQAQQWQADIAALQAQQAQLQPPALERLAQLLQRTRQEAQAAAVFARIRQLQPHNLAALWQDIVQRVDRADPSALPLLQQLAQRNPAYTSRACALALDVLERMPADDERTAKRRAWTKKQDDCLEQEEQFNEEMRASALLTHTVPHDLDDYELQDLIASAQRAQHIGKLWLLRKTSRTLPWRKLYVAVIQPATGKADSISMPDLEQTLDVPGVLICIQHDWLTHLAAPDKPPALGDAVYDKVIHKLPEAARA